MPLHVHDQNYQGTVECTDITRSQTDAYRVTVRELIGGYNSWVGGKKAAQDRMRRLARRMFSNARGTRTTLLNEYRDQPGGSEYATFLVEFQPRG